VTTAATGEQASESFCQVPLDLTILDLNPAGVDGLEALDFIKHHRPEHPVIILTGVRDDELLVKKALAGRAKAIVRKMSSVPSLLAEVRRRLPRSSSAEASMGGVRWAQRGWGWERYASWPGMSCEVPIDWQRHTGLVGRPHAAERGPTATFE
jgi:DNA-binding response OmpR family regulator